MLTQKRLKEVLHYDPATGHFTWIAMTSQRIAIGDRAGVVGPTGYILIGVDCGKYGAQRLAFLYMNGHFPRGRADHIDGNPSNNAWANLRDVSHQANIQNMTRASKNNKLGVLGVHKRGNRYRASIAVNGGTKKIGSFRTLEEASAAYIKWKRELHEGCTI